MTPKEKAQEIFDKFYIETYGFASEQAKKFSLIGIDEILKVGTFHRLTSENEYWEEVKKEIGKL